MAVDPPDASEFGDGVEFNAQPLDALAEVRHPGHVAGRPREGTRSRSQMPLQAEADAAASEELLRRTPGHCGIRGGEDGGVRRPHACARSR